MHMHSYSLDDVLALSREEFKAAAERHDPVVWCAMRESARAMKNYGEADAIRTDFENRNYIVHDTDDGSTWHAPDGMMIRITRG